MRSQREKELAFGFLKNTNNSGKKSVKESGLSNLQFIIKLTNEYAKEYNLGIDYIPMPEARGRKEGYNEYK